VAIPGISELRTARLIVRPVRSEDLSDLAAFNSDDAVTRHLPYESWKSPDDALAWLTRMRSLEAAGTAQQLVIELTEHRQVIGTVLLFRYEASSARLEIGYVLARSHWREGMASEALRGILDHLFRTRGIRRIEAEIRPENEASLALVRNLGFTQEGRLRKRWVDKGEAHDTCFFGLLAEEWGGT
jgi:[ribosomal protein S5]-alanine N-acetyltransferase